MSNAIQTDLLLEPIRAAIVAAWAGVTVDFGQPLTPRAAPYAVILAKPVSVAFNGPGAGLNYPGQTHRFDIVGRFPFPADPTQNILLQKVAQADALIAQLQPGPVFGASESFQGGFNPLVVKVDYGELDDINEKVYELTLSFQVQTIAGHS